MGNYYNPFTNTSGAPGGAERGTVWYKKQQADV